jgi:hypothetical protein
MPGAHEFCLRAARGENRAARLSAIVKRACAKS